MSVNASSITHDTETVCVKLPRMSCFNYGRPTDMRKSVNSLIAMRDFSDLLAIMARFVHLIVESPPPILRERDE